MSRTISFILVCLLITVGSAFAAQTVESINIEMVGINQPVTLANGQITPAINFDNAATTPPFSAVMRAVAQEAAMYGSIGRGKGQKSEHSTEVYEYVRGEVLKFFNAPPEKYMAVFVGNTTEGLNRLALSLLQNKDDLVLTSRMEHHANDLPWRAHGQVIYAEVDELGRLDMASLEKQLVANTGKVKFVTISAASNVTGYINNVHRIAALAHQYGALMIVDGAQIAAHRPFSMQGNTPEEDVDFFVFSAHKMYAPFGGGAIIGRRDVMEQMPMAFTGGGVVDVVGDERETYLQHEARLEPGSPNYFGVVALGEAMKVFNTVGFERIVSHEQELFKKMITEMAQIEGVTLYGDNKNIDDRVGIVIFNIEGLSDAETAEQLAARRGIAVRQGAFCAHPYVARLMKVNPVDGQMDNADFHLPGMVRASIGIYNTEAEVDEFIKTVREIAAGR